MGGKYPEYFEDEGGVPCGAFKQSVNRELAHLLLIALRSSVSRLD
jgi:hypothetical protein